MHKVSCFSQRDVQLLKHKHPPWWCFCFTQGGFVREEEEDYRPHLEESNKDTGVWWRERLVLVNAPLGSLQAETSTNISIITRKKKKEACWLPGREPRCSRQHVWALSRKGQRLLLKRGLKKKKATLPFPVAFSTTGCRDELLSSPHSQDKIGSEGQTSESDASRSPGGAWMWSRAFICRRLCIVVIFILVQIILGASMCVCVSIIIMPLK